MAEGTPQQKRTLQIFDTPDKRQRIDDIIAMNTELLRQPSLPDRQKLAMNSRAMTRFGKEMKVAESFADLAIGTVFPLLVKYYHRYNPSNPTLQDLRRSLSGGYVQQCVHLTLAHVVQRGMSEKTEGWDCCFFI